MGFRSIKSVENCPFLNSVSKIWNTVSCVLINKLEFRQEFISWFVEKYAANESENRERAGRTQCDSAHCAQRHRHSLSHPNKDEL